MALSFFLTLIWLIGGGALAPPWLRPHIAPELWNQLRLWKFKRKRQVNIVSFSPYALKMSLYTLFIAVYESAVSQQRRWPAVTSGSRWQFYAENWTQHAQHNSQYCHDLNLLMGRFQRDVESVLSRKSDVISSVRKHHTWAVQPGRQLRGDRGAKYPSNNLDT